MCADGLSRGTQQRWEWKQTEGGSKGRAHASERVQPKTDGRETGEGERTLTSGTTHASPNGLTRVIDMDGM